MRILTVEAFEVVDINSTPCPFKWRHFLPEIILLNVLPFGFTSSLRRETHLLFENGSAEQD
ncbi:hypothetical protein IFO70_34280 [Phormidium tenue FACHB-886]|nr:hypothetical protein [Phormidium tenue FACHB-886]